MWKHEKQRRSKKSRKRQRGKKKVFVFFFKVHCRVSSMKGFLSKFSNKVAAGQNVWLVDEFALSPPPGMFLEGPFAERCQAK